MNSPAVSIYHNPACGTSRNTLALIRNAGVEPTVIEYLKTPPDRATLEWLIGQMGISPRQLLREKGTPYAELGLDSTRWSDEQLIDHMLANPILINRPIVATPWGVKLCRPSEAVLDVLPLPQKGTFSKEDGELLIDAEGRCVSGKSVDTKLPDAAGSAASLNDNCYCRTLDAETLNQNLRDDAHSGEIMSRLLSDRPTLFSSTAIFLAQETYQQVVSGIACLERVIRSPGYQTAALQQAPAIAGHDFGPLGVFVSHDFHLAPDGPRLIEINSNAGGALLAAALARAQHACCQAMNQAFMSGSDPASPEHAFLEMFSEEWRRQRPDSAPRSVAIVDDDPSSQYLAPEFQLFQRLFERADMISRIIDPCTLQWRDGRLWHETMPIDMIYNRLTDFYLADPRHQALRDAYEAGAIVLTPHPRTHALYADKRNLIGLGQAPTLRQWGVPEADIERLERLVPTTRLVTPDIADALWAQRRTLFFKPTAGFGAKATYRGDKLTRRVWNEILAGSYVAQALITPGERAVEVDGVPIHLKFDLRAYSYNGSVQLLAARMYSGQTTNFRTPGGGFAAVAVLPS